MGYDEKEEIVAKSLLKIYEAIQKGFDLMVLWAFLTLIINK